MFVRILPAVLAALILLSASSSEAAITVTNGTVGSVSATASISVPFTSNVSAASALFGVVRNATGGGTHTWSDNNGNTWIELYAAANGIMSVGYTLNANAGATTVTVNSSVGANLRLNIFEVTGVATASAVDQQASAGPINSTTPTTGATGNRTQANEVLLGFLTTVTAPSALTTGTGFTIINNQSNFIATEYQVVNSAGTDAINYTLGSSVNWTIYGVTVKAVSVGLPIFLIE